jgi:hypothetical protein
MSSSADGPWGRPESEVAGGGGVVDVAADAGRDTDGEDVVGLCAAVPPHAARANAIAVEVASRLMQTTTNVPMRWSGNCRIPDKVGH